jgi:hypothetical protein
MDTRDLDRLVTQTELSPLVKVALRRVRRAISEGNVESFSVSKHSWSVRVSNPRGLSCTWTFYLRKTTNGNTNTD